MGVMKFRLPSNDPAQRAPEYRKAYVTGLDRTPGRVGVELRNGLMTCIRDTTESGRVFVPWPIEGHGTPIVGTATLAERPAPVRARRRAGARQAQRRAEPARRLDPDGPAVDPRAGRRARGGPAGLHPCRDVVRPARHEPGGGPRRRATGLQRRRPADGGLHDPGLPEPAGDDLAAADAPGLRPGRRSPGRPAGAGLDPDVQRLPGRRRRGGSVGAG